MTRMESAFPAQKVIAGGIAGASATVLIYVLNTYVLPGPMPAEIAAAATTLVAAAIAYIVPPSPNDRIVTTSAGEEIGDS